MAQPYKIENWHICISGFRQHEEEPTGIHKLWLKLRQLSSPYTSVMLREWNADWRSLAELIAQTSINSLGPKVYVYAYSWGAGYGMVQLAKYLLAPGIEVQSAVLADPVYRSRSWMLRWLSLTPWGNIRVPQNVRKVYWTRQFENWPRAHELSAKSPNTRIAPPVIIHRFHRFMDEDPAFQSMCMDVAGLSSG